MTQRIGFCILRAAMRMELIIDAPPSRGEYVRAVVAALAVGGLMTVSAWVRVPLPFSPVPVTLQTLVVLLAGFLATSQQATAGMLIYLACGMFGVPIFAVPFGPTFGYILAFVAAPGIIAQFRNVAWGMITVTAMIWLLGAAWLAFWLRCPPVHAMLVGVLPFVPGDVVKMVIAYRIAQRIPRHA